MRLFNKHTRLVNCLTVATVIILSLCLPLYFAIQKQGFQVDEVWTYGLSNSDHKPFLDSHTQDKSEPQKISGDYYKEYLTVGDDDGFKYDSVIYNQEHDVHPPLFYMIIHTISSFLPGQFDKWIGILPNLVYLLVTLIFIYLIACKLTKNKLLRLLCVAFYGFSVGAISSVIFIRMYMMLAMFTTIYAYYHIKILVDNQQKWQDMLALAIITFLGFYTQYYFVIIAAFISLGYVVHKLLCKQYKVVLKYVGIMLLPLLVMLIVFPSAYTTMLGINKDQTGFNHAQFAMSQHGGYLTSLKQFIYFLNSELFGGVLMPLMVLSIILVLVHVIRRTVQISPKSISFSIRKTITISSTTVATYLVLFACILYVAVVARITFHKVDRYLFPIYPIVDITAVLILYSVIKLIAKKRAIVATTILLAALTILQYVRFTPNGYFPYTLYSNDAQLNKYFNSNKNKPCVYLYESGNEWGELADSPWLIQCSTIYKAEKSDIGQLPDLVDTYDDEFTLFIGKGIDADSLLNQIRDKYESISHIHKTDAINHWSTTNESDIYNIKDRL